MSVSHKHMKKCSLLFLAGASAIFERPYGDSLNVRVKSNPYRMFVTRGDQDLGTCYVLHPRSVTRQVEGLRLDALRCEDAERNKYLDPDHRG